VIERSYFTMDSGMALDYLYRYDGGGGYNRWAGASEKSQAATRRGELAV
jgi:hypothetical protein